MSDCDVNQCGSHQHRKTSALFLRIVFVGFLLFFANSLNAQVTPVPAANPLQALSGASGIPIQGPWDAAGSLAAMKQMYQTLVIQLQELKAQSKFLSDVNKVAKESLRQYDAVKNISLSAMKKRLEEDIEALTMLDNLGGMSERKKMDTLIKEMDRRIADPRISHKELQRLKREASFAQALSRLQYLEDAANQNLVKSAGAMNEREGQQITSQSVAILVKLQILENKRQYNEFMAGVNDNEMRQKLSRPSDVIGKIGGHSQSSLNSEEIP